MSKTLKPEDLLFHELEQQYLQYRHLDNLRERYVWFYIASIGTLLIFFIQTRNLDKHNPLVLLFLLIAGFFVLSMAISIRIAQKLTSIHLMEIRKELIKLLPLNNESERENKIGVCCSYLKASYTPPKNMDKWYGLGWSLNESAIQLIILLMAVNNTIFTYFVNIKYQPAFWLLFSVSLSIQSAQMLFLYIRFKYECSLKKQKQREKDMRKVLENICECPIKETKKSD